MPSILCVLDADCAAARQGSSHAHEASDLVRISRALRVYGLNPQPSTLTLRVIASASCRRTCPCSRGASSRCRATAWGSPGSGPCCHRRGRAVGGGATPRRTWEGVPHAPEPSRAVEFRATAALHGPERPLPARRHAAHLCLTQLSLQNEDLRDAAARQTRHLGFRVLRCNQSGKDLQFGLRRQFPSELLYYVWWLCRDLSSTQRSRGTCEIQ